ncbi:hypothetical protein K402DRAFT_379521 [Aulographum hederae CBS 113979]|uniref:Uncharacterized protein n=1 Tax=Aulographum hederae CBS 113979 TaxID=1176131 RepID=A0A6G1GW88_9PEZI|nr:hypothetical protein K402DRAFT_379521 [Aulographum hederae CBS 113979]
MDDADGDRIGRPTNPDGLVLEAWAQGYMVGSLIIMACITCANMRRGVLLHKLILIELLFGMFHGTFIFTHPPVYGWYLSVTAVFLNISWSLHNCISWMKSRPFLSRKVSVLYIGTVILAQPYWVLEIYANFAYFNNINKLFVHTRPWEALFRDPWWIFTSLNLFYNIKRRYSFPLISLIRISPRFGIMLASMLLSVLFIIVDIVSVTDVFSTHALPDGINPFWKMAFIYKCLTDSIILDDFKTALDRLHAVQMERMGCLPSSSAGSNGSPGRGGHHPGRLGSLGERGLGNSFSGSNGSPLRDTIRNPPELGRDGCGDGGERGSGGLGLGIARGAGKGGVNKSKFTLPSLKRKDQAKTGTSEVIHVENVDEDHNRDSDLEAQNSAANGNDLSFAEALRLGPPPATGTTRNHASKSETSWFDTGESGRGRGGRRS